MAVTGVGGWMDVSDGNDVYKKVDRFFLYTSTSIPSTAQSSKQEGVLTPYTKEQGEGIVIKDR